MHVVRCCLLIPSCYAHAVCELVHLASYTSAGVWPVGLHVYTTHAHGHALLQLLLIMYFCGHVLLLRPKLHFILNGVVQ